MSHLKESSKKTSRSIFLFLVLTMFLFSLVTGCGRDGTSEADINVIAQTKIAATPTSQPAATFTPVPPTPTYTLAPTDTPTPTVAPTDPSASTLTLTATDTPALTPTLPLTFTPVPPARTSTPAFPSVDILPLAVGNTWSYSKHIHPDKNEWYWREIPLKQGGAFVTIGRSCHPGTYVETFEITGNVEEPLEGISGLEVKVDSPAECQGRYTDAVRIIWYLESASIYEGQGVDAIRGRAVERIVYDSTKLPPNRINSVKTPPVHGHKFLMVWESLGNRWELRETRGGSIAEMIYKDFPISVTTPAGSFDKCVEVIEDVKPNPEIEDKDDPFVAGWITYSYFCSGVGLVKEIQKDRNGEVMYTLELTSFTTPVRTKYSFENSTMGWKCQDYEDSRACIKVLLSEEQAREGEYSLEMVTDLVSGDMNNSQGEAWVDLRERPPSGEHVPIDFTNRTVTAWVYAPKGSRGERNRPNGFQLFVKDENWHSEYGSWYNVNEGHWFKISMTVSDSKPTNGWIDPEFDPSRIIAVGVKMGSGGGSKATYEGPIYIDAIGW